MKDFGSNMADDQYNTSQSNLAAAQGEPHAAAQQQQQLGGQSQHDDDPMSQDLRYLSREAPLDGGESTFGAYSQLGGAHHQSHSAGLESADEQPAQADSSTFRFGTESPFDLSGEQAAGQQQQLASHYVHSEAALEQLAPDNVDIQRPMQQAGQVESAGQTTSDAADASSSFPLKPFLVSFMVDARGGAMRGCRHSGVRVIIPPNSAPMPMRITCRYLRRERLVHPPPLMEGEACASKIMEVGPAGAKFLGPVLIEVPHFASLRGKEREIIILRSDSGEVWREHLVDADEQLIESIIETAERMQQAGDAAGDDASSRPRSALDGNVSGGDKENDDKSAATTTRRLTRIVTNEFPQYFAIISRIRQEVHTVGPEGSTVNSQVVPRVQAIFTDGALTKRIKIGLQKGSRKADQPDQAQQQQQDSNAATNNELDNANEARGDSRAQSPDGRPQSAASQQSTGAKRRSRFLACFGTGRGSIDLLDPAATSEHSSNADASSNGDESPRQPANEKLVERRRIIEDISDSEADPQSSPSVNSTRGGAGLAARKKRHAHDTDDDQQLVPEDYYIEREPPLILNVEPKTYGKRLASSSAQTDQKLQANGVLSTSTRKTKKRGLLGRGKRGKTNLTIHCDPPAADDRTANGEVADSSLEYDDAHKQQHQIRSIIRDTIDDGCPKSRTCTIQTDSDSVIVNYVTINPNDAAANQNAASTQTGASQDDGYVSGSGDLKREQHGKESSTFGKSLFSPFCASGTGARDDDSRIVEADEANDELSLSVADEQLSKRAQKKQRAKQAAEEKSKKKLKKKEKASGRAATEEADDKRAAAASADQKSVDLEKRTQTPSIGELVAEVKEIEQQQQQEQPQSESLTISGTDEAGDESQATLTEATTTRSISPTTKELKLKLKLEKQEKAKREKLEKQKQKELDEAAAKAEKLRKKAEKEAKKAQEKLEKHQLKILKKNSSSPTGSKPESPEPTAELEVQRASVTIPSKVGQSVKFASELVESRQTPDSPAVDSNDQVVVGGELPQLPTELEAHSKSDEPTGGAVVGAEPSVHKTESSEISTSEAAAVSQQQPQLKPILKQSSSSFEEEPQSVEIVIGEPKQSLSLASVATKLVKEATDEAVRVADELKARETGDGSSPLSSPTLTSSLSESKKEAAKRLKEEKDRLKREAKAKLEEEKRAAKEAKTRLKEVELAIKQAEAEALRTAEEAEKACKLAELQAKKAAEEAKRAQEEAKRAAEIELAASALDADGQLVSAASDDQQPQSTSSDTVTETDSKKLAKEAKRAKKLAELEAKKLAKAAKVEAERAAQEAKKKLKLDKKLKKGDKQRRSSTSSSSSSKLPSAPTIDLIESAEQQQEAATVSRDNTESAAAPEVLSDAADLSAAAESEVAKLAGDDEQQVPTSESSKTIDVSLDPPKRAAGEEKESSEAATLTVGSSTVVDSVDAKDKGGKKKKEKKQKKKSKDKAAKESATAADNKTSISTTTTTSEQLTAKDDAAATSSSKSSFFSRLFGNKGKRAAAAAAAGAAKLDEAQSGAAAAEQQADDKQKSAAEQKMLIVSEMYPSDPNDADGEMILEVNVPQNLIDKQIISAQQQQQQPQTADLSSQPQTLTNATTTTTTNHLDQDDQEATLVNISQMADLEEEQDEATENIVSQANELAQDILGQAEESSTLANKSFDISEDLEAAGAADPSSVLKSSASSNKSPVDEQQSQQSAAVERSKRSVDEPPAATKSGLALSATKDALQDAKKQKELEVKLEKEAKKRAKEEEQLRKKQEKEQKKLAELEAKKRLAEEREQAKRDAQEAKRLAKLAKKQAEEDKKRAKEEAKRLKKQKVSAAVEASQQQQPSEATSQAQPELVSSSSKIVEHTEEPNFSRTTTIETTDAQTQPRGDTFDLANMSPVNEETETEKIVEEVVGEDGTVTKTTKVVETKYVTMRQEELRLGERREIPVEEWEQIQRDEEQQLARRHSHSSSADSESRIPIQVQHATSSQPKVIEYHHEELEQIRATPSYFSLEQRPAELKENLAPKKEFKKRLQLNRRLIKRATKLAQRECKQAKRESSKAQAEIAVCDEAARQAQRQLKRALKEAKRAAKVAQKEHKKMDKVDKKLAKEAKKLEKRQRKLDKRQAKLARKESLKREKLAKKAAKEEEKQRKSSGGSAATSSSAAARRSIRLEDISEPVLRSSSRLSIGQQQSGAPDEQQLRQSPSDEAVQLDLSLDENQLQQQQQHRESLANDQLDSGTQMSVTRTVTIESPDGQVAEHTSEFVLSGREAEAAAIQSELEAARDEEDEMIDVVGDDGREQDDQEEQSPPTPPEEQPQEGGATGSAKKNKKKNKRRQQVAE